VADVEQTGLGTAARDECIEGAERPIDVDWPMQWSTVADEDRDGEEDEPEEDDGDGAENEQQSVAIGF
jgi:hypothetical protein